MSDIPLKVLIVDPDQGSSTRLTQVLRLNDNIISTESESSLEVAREIVAKHDINVMYIDPISFGIEQTSVFVIAVRVIRPELVYVLYMRISDLGSLDQELIFGGFRFELYFKLDKNASKSIFKSQVERTIAACQSDLSFSLNKEKIGVLQEELRFLQKSAGEDPANVSAQTLRDIQDQLSVWRKELELSAKERRRYSASFLGPEAESVIRNRCFVVMPYSQDWSKAVESILCSCCEDAGLKFAIAKAMEGRFIPYDIWQGITGCGIIIADLTGGNANVAYEVGLADAIGKEVILISQESNVPFDFSGQRLIIYENSIAGSFILKDELTKRLLSVKNLLEETEGA